MSSTLGQKVRNLRRGKGVTLDQLAQATGTNKNYIWELENKSVTEPSAEKLALIAECLGVTTDFLIDQELSGPRKDETDLAFLRKFWSADPAVKEKLKRILDVLDDDEK